MAKRQLRIAGTEGKSNREVDVAAEAYVQARDERMAKTEAEVAAKETLIGAMKKAKLNVYRDDAATPPLVITLVDGKPNVKVTEAPDAEDDGGEDFGDEPRGRRRSAAAASVPAEE